MTGDDSDETGGAGRGRGGARGDRGSAAAAWDQVGRFMEGSGEVGQRLVQRNLDLWRTVAESLRAERYTADRLADDAAYAFGTAVANLGDLWTLVTRPPQGERGPGAVPTAFLFFDRRDAHTFALLDPVSIPVAPPVEGQLPQRAEIALSGSSEKGSAALRGVLVAHLDETGGGYVLETQAEPSTDLLAGVYDGFVYITDPPRPLANLRIVVEGPPPTV
jgi:hypothetical protein